MGNRVDTKGIDQADVLCALYNNSRAQGMGFLHFTPQDMTREQAVELLAEFKDFDYLQGRVMKVDLRDPDSFDPFLYDRDLGDGAADRAIAPLRQQASSAA